MVRKPLARIGRAIGIAGLSLISAVAAAASATAQDVPADSVSESGSRTILLNASCVSNIGVLSDGAAGIFGYCIAPTPSPSYTITFNFSPAPSQFMSGIRLWANAGATYSDGELRQFDLEVDHIDPVTNTPRTLRLEDVNIGDTLNMNDPKFVSLTGANPQGLYQVSAVRMSDLRGTGNQIVFREVQGVFTTETIPPSQETVAQIGNFLETRAQLILLHQPDLTRRIERLEGRYTESSGLFVEGLPVQGAGLPFAARIGRDDISFAYSLRRSQAEGSGAPRLHFSGLVAEAPEDPGPAPVAPPGAGHFDLWAEAQLSRFDTAGGGGTFGTLFLGADYLVRPDVLLGFVLQGDWTSLDGTNGGNTEGFGYLIGPYMIARLDEGFYLDARLGWGRSENSISPFGTYTDGFDAERWLATAALVGSLHRPNGLILTPEARLSYFREESDPYVDGLGATIPAIEVEIGLFEFGPTLTRDYQLGDGTVVSPFVTGEGIWTFAQANTATALTGTRYGAGEGLRGRIELGIDYYNLNGTTLHAAINYDGIGSSDFESWGFGLLFRREF